MYSLALLGVMVYTFAALFTQRWACQTNASCGCIFCPVLDTSMLSLIVVFCGVHTCCCEVLMLLLMKFRIEGR